MEQKTIYALGFFDGVHLGHQALLRSCVALAGQENATPAAITFSRHPRSFFTPTPPLLINSAADRCRLLTAFGMHQVVELPVDAETMNMPWERFFETLRNKNAAGFVCGEDYRFGCHAEGDAQKLKAACDAVGLPCVIVAQQELDGIRISSTHIRTLLEQGEMEQAVRFLGHPYILTGEVVPGRQLGRTIGIPTANIALAADLAVPKHGVYACKCTIDGSEYVAVTNIGSRPTVQGHQVRVESWILNFKGDLYGRELSLEFYKFLRPEKRFDSLEQMRIQINQDAWYAWETFHGR